MLDARRQVGAMTFRPEERPDWDHARTRRLALRVPSAEWCQSARTYRGADGLYRHGTDYAYEGLLSLSGGENWKILDHLGFQVLVGGQAVELVPEAVTATPDWVRYAYSSPVGRLEIRYQLFAVAQTGVLGARYRWRPAGAASAELRLRPVFDLRHMFYYSDAEGHRLEHREARLLTVSNHRHVALATDTDCAWHPEHHLMDLSYRIGSGDRELRDGAVRFKREGFRGVSLGLLGCSLEDEVQVTLAAATCEDEAIQAARYVQVEHVSLARAQEAALAACVQALPEASPEVQTRAYVMAEKHGLRVGGCRLPETGAWWFRTAWLRPLFSGLLHNHRTLERLGGTARLTDAIRLALRYQDPLSGRLPNRLPDHTADLAHFQRTKRLPSDFYQHSDPLLPLFVLLSEAPVYLDEPALAEGLHALFSRSLAAFEAADGSGRPALCSTGLLLTPAGYSWLNSRRRLEDDGLVVSDLPTRVDREWQLAEIRRFQDGHYAQAQYQQSAFYLPDINAQWIRMLEVGLSLADLMADPQLTERLEAIYERAIANFRRLFWNSGVGFLYNLITKEGRPDPMVTSPGIEAVALLGSRVFTRQDLAAVWSTVRSHLLVSRQRGGRPVAFGVIAKDSAERIFLGDEQSHEAVCWPRETPHLLRLLEALEDHAAIQEILESNLAHQAEEGAVFYASEILSLPEGGNPAPGLPTGQDPVPVKNPMQWASLWCDPYLARV